MSTVGDRLIMKSATDVEMPIPWPVGEAQGGQLPRLGYSGQRLGLMTWIQEPVVSRVFRGQV